MRCRIAYEHVAEGSTVIDGNADADGITVRVNHRCQMAGRVLPVRYSLFGNSIGAVTVNTVRLEPKPWGYIRTQPTIRKGSFHDCFCAATVDYLFDLQLCLWYATMISEDRNADFRYGSIV